MEKSSEKRVNIPRSNVEPFYRYTMPVMSISTTGKNQTTLTLIENLPEIAKDLETKPEYLLEYFKLTFNSPTMKGTSYGIRGKYTRDQLEKALDTFIEKYVLCTNCRLPELNTSAESKCLSTICRACGHSANLPSSKMSSFLTKQLQIKEPEQRKDARKKKDVKEIAQDDTDYFLASMKNNPLTQSMFNSQTK